MIKSTRLSSQMQKKAFDKIQPFHVKNTLKLGTEGNFQTIRLILNLYFNIIFRKNYLTSTDGKHGNYMTSFWGASKSLQMVTQTRIKDATPWNRERLNTEY